MNIREIITLSELLGEMGDIKRGTRLPNGESEPDSHHCFMLALTAYEVCKKIGLALDFEKLLLYGLVHDLPEIINGDVWTLKLSTEELKQKEKNDDESMPAFIKKFHDYPEIVNAVKEYERLDTIEANSVYVLDKACTTWTHFPDDGDYMRRDHGLTKKH